jgi:hypothetical protein
MKRALAVVVALGWLVALTVVLRAAESEVER